MSFWSQSQVISFGHKYFPVLLSLHKIGAMYERKNERSRKEDTRGDRELPLPSRVSVACLVLSRNHITSKRLLRKLCLLTSGFLFAASLHFRLSFLLLDFSFSTFFSSLLVSTSSGIKLSAPPQLKAPV